MNREIEATTTIPVPFAAACALLRADPAALFGGRSHPPSGAGDRVFSGVIAAPVGGGTLVEHPVTLTVGRVHLEALAASIPIEWAPDRHERVLPSFRGRLLLVPDESRSTRLELFGTYHVPLGALGRFGDTVVGRRVARASVVELLERVAARIVEARAEESAHRPPSPTPYNVDLREPAVAGVDRSRPEHFIG